MLAADMRAARALPQQHDACSSGDGQHLTGVRPFPNRWLVADDDLHSARRRGQPPSKDASTSAWQSPSVGPGAATNQTNDGTCDDRVVSATVRSTIAGTSFFFAWNYHYFLLELFLLLQSTSVFAAEFFLLEPTCVFSRTGFFVCYNRLSC